MLKFANTLFGRVVLALVLGIILGVSAPSLAESLKPLGDGFIKLIQMIIAPLVFCVVVSGIGGAGDLNKVGRVGVKTVVYFEIITTFALFIGVISAYLLHPGSGMNLDAHSLDGSAMSVYADRARSLRSVSEFFLNLIPSTVVDAFAKGDILQVLVFAILIGVALSLLGEQGRWGLTAVDSITKILFKVIGLIINLAPVGVLGAIAFTTGKYGVAALARFGFFVAVFYLACATFVLVVLGSILRLAGFNILKFIRYFREELLIVLGTASSDAVLPQVMRKLEGMGIKKSTVGLVIPTGYSFNLFGNCVAAVVIAAWERDIDLERAHAVLDRKDLTRAILEGELA